MRILLYIILLIMAPLTAAWGRGDFVDDRGVVLHFSHPPQRVISLLPSLTESVCVVSACARLIATDRYSNWPASVTILPKLGGLEDAHIERIVALQPDLVLVSPGARVIARLESLGIPVMAMESKNHADVRRSLLVLAEILGDRSQGEAAIAKIAAQLQRAASEVPDRYKKKRVYFEADGAPYAAGPASFIGESLTQMGLGNIVPSSMGAFPKLNPEFIVAAEPDLIMAPKETLAHMAERPGWKKLKAVTHGQVCGFTALSYETLVRPGPRMGEAALEISRCLQGLARHTP